MATYNLPRILLWEGTTLARILLSEKVQPSQDEVLGRMSSAKELGLSGAVEYFDFLINKAVSFIPNCERDDYLKKLIKKESQRLVPKKGRIKIIKTTHDTHNKKKSSVISSF